jgi:adenosine/AMP kinase
MSVCLDTSSVLANQVSTSTATSISDEATIASQSSNDQAEASPQQPTPVRTIAKLPSTGNATLSKASLITVLNTPLGNVKTLCVTPAVSSNATGQFTVVNSATSLNVANSTVKPQTITLINTPVTVVKTISPNVEKSVADVVPNSSNVVAAATASVPALIENRGHNVFVKNTACAENVAVAAQDVPQSHKLLTANNFPTNNVLTTAISVNDVNVQKTANGQRNKVKILSNVLMPGTSQGASNIVLSKPSNVQQRYVSRQKVLGANNGATTKYLNKPPNNLINKQSVNMINKQQPSQRVLYPTHKSQIKTLPPVNNYLHGKPPGIKTLPPHSKGVPGQVQRTGSGLRTIPPQRPQKIANKPNYIGKHAVQAQKLKQPHKLKNLKPNQVYNSYHNAGVQEKQMTFNQALTAEIIETLSNKSGNMGSSYPNKNYESLPPRYENAYYPPDIKPTFEQAKPMEERNKSGLDLIYQAVLLDHNYNATLPPESPNRSIPTSTSSQMNGVSGCSMYSPGSGKRRTLSTSNPISSSTSLSTLSAVASNSNSVIGLQDEDAASDISDGSDRKQDTEGEETDTAPEAEAVNNEDQFGDYVTRCICGFIHDDGYMIECDRCKVWQHVQCVVKNKQVPDEYLCEVCDPHKHIDRQKARLAQQQWLRDRQFTDPKLRKDTKLKEVFKHKETLSDSDTSDGEHTGHNNNIIGKGRPNLVNRRKSDNHPKGGCARQRRDSAKETAQRRPIKKRERKVVKRKTKAQLKNHSDDENHESASSTHLPQLRQWIENYEEAVTNHYSPELRARISSIRVNGAHTDLSVQFDPSVHKCRVHTQPLTELKYLVSTVHLPPNSPVIELRGKYMLSAQHRNSGSTFNTRQHAQRPGPFLFFYRLHKDNTEVCVDTRTYGNSARFIRRSCKPNAELRHSIVKGVLHLYIVTIANVEKNVELTIKHESHDLAAIGTTHIACACGNIDECTVNRTTIKKNGDSTDLHKKRRGRRTTSMSLSSEPEIPPTKPKKESIAQPPASPVASVKPEEEEEEEEEIKTEPEEAVKSEPEEVKPEVKEEVIEPVEEKPLPDVKEVKVKEEEVKVTPPPSTTPPIATRRSSSHHKVEKEEVKEPEVKEECSPPTEKNKNKKLSREERKLEAILRAIAQMEKADQRKQEHQAKQAHRRESEPGPGKDEDKVEPKLKRKRRKGRARTSSTNTPTNRRNRLNSTDSYLTSGDETLLSPHDNAPVNRPSMKDNDYKENTQGNQQNCAEKDVGLLLALSNGEKANKSPPRETDSNSNSAQSSPETHLSSACLLVQAAVEPMEQGFKFPKTKKVLMNEWLNKVPEPVHSASSISPSSLTPHINTSTDYDSNVGFYTPGKSLVALAQVASFCDTNVQPRGNAKKRWLRQAISEDQCDSPSGRPESPPISETIAPPKKRRLPRESLSNDITPPSTPTSLAPSASNNERQAPVQEGCVEIVYSGADEDSPTQAIEPDAVLEERVAEMKEEFSNCIVPPLQEAVSPTVSRSEMPSVTCLMDPRLSRDHHHIFSNSDHLVGTVEKTLSILGFEERKPEPITPAKRKLSITEYRQRKKLNNNDKTSIEEPVSTEENNSSESFKPLRPRSDSTSSCTSITSSDDEAPSLELSGKAPSAFNSEPTELERQRETTALRMKKVLGIAVDDESRKPALDVEAILNCELPPVVKTMPPSPNFPIPGSCDATGPKSSPGESAPPNPASKSPVGFVPPPEHEPAEAECEENEEKENDDGVQPNMFYTPDEEERGTDENAQGGYEEIDSVDYVPPFNNPIYPNDSNFTSYASVLDEEGRYEGRNPSPPPDLGTGNTPYPGQQT